MGDLPACLFALSAAMWSIKTGYKPNDAQFESKYRKEIRIEFRTEGTVHEICSCVNSLIYLRKKRNYA